MPKHESRTLIGSRIPRGTSGSVLFIDASGRLAQNNSQLFWDNVNSRLGIGTMTPLDTLDIKTQGAGSIRIGGHHGRGIRAFDVDGNPSNFDFQGGAGFATDLFANNLVHYATHRTALFLTSETVSLWTDARSRLTINNVGNVGIGTITPSERLDVNGNIRVAVNRYFQSGNNALIGGTTVQTEIYGVNNSIGFYGSLGSLYMMIKDGNVGIGATEPHTSALLDVASTTRGFLPPRMTSVQKSAISSPSAGLVVYDTTLGKLCVFTTAWETISSV